jgi:hypothetical protein
MVEVIFVELSVTLSLLQLLVGVTVCYLIYLGYRRTLDLVALYVFILPAMVSR